MGVEMLMSPGGPMGGKGGKKGTAPPPPDYKGAAEQTAVGNHANQSNPYGSSSWSQGPNGQWNQQIGFSPGMQGANDSMMSQAGSAWGSPLDNGSQARQHAEDAIYGRETSRLDPQWQQRQHDFQTQMANQGIDPNSQAYATASGNLNRAQNDAYQQANYGAITGGGQEASRQQGLDLNSRFAPLQGMSAMHGLLQMPQAPPGANYLAAAGMQGGYGLDAQQLNNQAMSDYWNGMMNLGKNVAGFAAGGQ